METIKQWVDQNDWEYDEQQGKVYNCDGDILFYINTIPDTVLGLIHQLIEVANEAYRTGYEYGKTDKQYEIKRVLGIV